MLTVEPDDAACLLASLGAGKPVGAPGPHHSHMVGLNCGNVAPSCWSILRDAVATAVAIGDAEAATAATALARSGIRTAATGAAGLAGLRAASANIVEYGYRHGFASTRALVLVTEGDTEQ